MIFPYSYPPKELMRALAKDYALDVFVETRTKSGRVAQWAAKHFEQVHTIDGDFNMLRHAEARLLNLRNVHTYWNDSRFVLGDILKKIGNRRILFWLDAYWEAGIPGSLPVKISSVLEEIKIINDCAPALPHVIMVNRSSRFNDPMWTPGLELCGLLEAGKREVKQLKNIYYAIPREEKLH